MGSSTYFMPKSIMNSLPNIIKEAGIEVMKIDRNHNVKDTVFEYAIICSSSSGASLKLEVMSDKIKYQDKIILVIYQWKKSGYRVKKSDNIEFKNNIIQILKENGGEKKGILG